MSERALKSVENARRVLDRATETLKGGNAVTVGEDGKENAPATAVAQLSSRSSSMLAIAAATGAAAIFEPELVQLYEPSVPTLTAARTGCPHTTGALLDWHNAATWNGAGVPSTAGADVTLPSSSRVLLSRSAANVTFGTLHVPAGSELVIGEHADGIALHATGVSVEGALRAGSETCRLTSPFTLTLHGTRLPTSCSWRCKGRG